MDQIGVMGAGTMGGGIAQAAAQAGLRVRMLDLSEALVKAGVEKIGMSLSRSVEKGRLTPHEKDEILSRIGPTVDLEELKDCRLIIEAVFEDLALKLDLFRRLETVCPPETILASNTSTLSITRIAAGISGSARVLGVHFFNPVPAMRLVEVIPGIQTSRQVVQKGIDFVKGI
ncbi:MAG TPA: 3-hydroxyacyl-CoA dehydrogenase NAD-binding domain-containing protein, partial [Thermodesulfobacteriota bacterium]|nr:3-hydroxyacyl-CoA dehydrogenase NAD-binding domain-containing protein [Thermodesulfobacteriota bacterium]